MKKKDPKKIKKAKQRFEVHSGKGRRFDLSRLKKGFVYYVLLLLALVVIVQVGYHWLGEQFLAWRLQVITASYGVLEQNKVVQGVVTRSEKVITAPASGVILELSEPGKRVSVGKELAQLGVLPDIEIPEAGQEEEGPLLENQDQENAGLANDNGLGMNINPEDEEQENETLEEPALIEFKPEDFIEIITIESEQSGLLSYYIDGMENREGPFYLAIEDYSDDDLEGNITAEDDLVKAGKPIMKIIDNWNWYYNIILPLHPGRSIALEEEVELVFKFAPGENVRAELARSEIDNDKREVRLSYLIERQLPGFDQARLAEATLIYVRKEGVIIPAEAVFEKDQTTGIYINQGGRVVFQPVTVTGRQEDQVMVENLEPNSLVITRHEMVEEGRRLN